MSEQDVPESGAPPEAGEKTESRAQPPDSSGQTTQWAQPPGAGARGLHGSTKARQQTPNLQSPDRPALHARVDRDDVTTQPGWPDHAPMRTFTPTVESCPRCGGRIDYDGYCQTCGAKAPSVREYFEASPSSWAAGISDRGIRHSRNEDAMALDASAEVGGQAVLVVCDGVSMSADSDKASLAAARAAVGHFAGHDDWSQNLGDWGPGSQARAITVEAARVANQAVLDHSDLTRDSPASCTLAIGLVSGRHLLAATLGDTRVYWLPDHGAASLLSTDDSMAQEQIAAGVEREIAETGIHGHVITRWLGRDAPDIVPSLAGTLAEGPGWLLVCSDGLWNYASAPEPMGRLVGQLAARDVAALPLARALVDWANEQGGHDNITVALARIDAPPAARLQVLPGAADLDGYDVPTTRTRPVAPVDPASAG